jgi:hypothetical protein
MSYSIGEEEEANLKPSTLSLKTTQAKEIDPDGN